MSTSQQLDNWIDEHFDPQVSFLQELIRVPTDTPPGNNAPHAQRTAELLKAMGMEAEQYPVPEAEVRACGLEKVEGIHHPCLNVGMIEGGTNTNLVPGRVSFKLDRRMIPEENPAQVEDTLHQIVLDAAAELPGVAVEIKRLLLANAMQPLPGNRPLVEAIQKHDEIALAKGFPRLERRCTPTCACSAKPAYRVLFTARGRAAYWSPMPNAPTKGLSWKTCAAPRRSSPAACTVC
jgi:acetylornithine deacetylase/succinyl-diaminopimelate desuccinylase-like protein